MRVKVFESKVYKASHISYIFPSLRFAKITEGAVDWQIGEKVYKFSKGDVILLNNLTARKMHNVYGEMLKMDVFEFSPEEIRGSKKMVSLFYGENTACVRAGESPLFIHILDLLKSAGENDALSYHLLQSSFCALEETLFSSQVSGMVDLAFDAASYIWENAGEDISVPKVAERLSVSKSHLENEFKRVHGIGVGEYIRTIRVYNADRLIRLNPERSVLDIALTCGFKSSSGFYKAYKTIMKRQPKKRNGK